MPSTRIKKMVDSLGKHRQVSSQKTFKKQEAIYAEPDPPLPPEIVRYLTAQGYLKLYSHQVEVVEKARQDENIVLVTSTASGKTLAFIIPALERLAMNADATALFIYPMKALAYDQLKEFKSLEKGTGIAFSPAVYDGDTPKSKRRGIRNKSRVILTNPHALHLYLSWHKLWQRFFSNLKFVVIDEAHWYRGIFGSNVAYLLRRLQRILDYYQNPEPQFILASATMADPVEHAQKLTGREFSLVARDGSAKGKKTYFFWDTTKNLDKSQHLQTAELFAACVENNLQTLCFTVSRKMSELTARWAQEKVKDVASYRAGYLAEERRELEEKFKKGEIRGLSSTNALELGINIGGLDAVVIGGYPGTVSSFHQQAGRAGRTGQESLVVQVLYENPLDSYMLTNPNYLFQEPTEQAVISLDNEHFLKSHLLCAAEELPLTAADSRWFGPRCSAIAEELRKEKKLVLKKKASKTKQAKETIYIKEYHCVDKGACFQVGLSSFERERYQLICEGEILEELSERQTYTEAHPGAIFLHQMEPYRITNVDDEKKIIIAERTEGDCFTTPLTRTDIEVLEVIKKREYDQLRLNYGSVRVTESVYGYLLKSPQKTLKQKEVKLPPLPFMTKAVWLQASLTDIKGDLAGGLHGAEHLLIAVTPLLAMCDRWDIGGVSIEKRENEIYIYDGYPGGIGIAERLYTHFKQLVEKALEIGVNCSCYTGCPRCIISPKCGNNNEPLDKGAALTILKTIYNQVGNKNGEDG